MEAKNLGNYLTQKLVHKCAMKSVSTEYPLTDEMLKKYRNELDWDEVSSRIKKIIEEK